MAQNTITTKGVLIINGKQVENTFNELYSRTKKLQQELKKLKPGTQEFLDKASELKRVKAQFDAVRQEIFATNQEIKKSEGIFSRFFGSIAGGLTQFEILGRVKNIFTSTTQELLKVSDAITDVQKTSGLAQKEVEALWKEFSNFDTRTSKLELMNIAQIGGRLGITDKEQLQEFTREIDKIYVALGDSFQGGLEEVTTKVGKLKNLFDETKGSDYPTALNEIGSALNELGANGTASESNITEFATRIGQLPSALKPAIDKTLGLGAAFEESGIDAQIAASGYSRFMSVAGNNLDNFAKQMKITKDEAQELFRTKPEEFFIRFGESMKGIPADQTAKILKDLDLNTLEIKKSLGAAGDNADRFRQMMELSSKSMIEATSIQEEFNKKNENATAIWEKIGRAVKDFVTDGAVPDFFNWVTGIVGKITGIMSEAGNGMEVFRKRLTIIAQIVKIATMAFVGYKTAIIVSTIATKDHTKATLFQTVADKAQTAALFLKRAGILLYNVVLGVLTLNTQRATNAMIAFNAVTKTTPWGVILGLISAVATAYFTLSDSVKKTTDQKKILADANKKVAEETAKETHNVKQLLKTAQDHTKSLKERQEAVDELNKIVPQYNNQLTIESVNTLDATNKLKEYIEAIKDAAREKYFKTLVDQKAEELAKAENSSLADNIEWYEAAWNRVKSLGDTHSEAMANFNTATQNQTKSIKKAQQELDNAVRLYNEQKNKNKKNAVLPDSNSPKEGDTKTENGITYIFKNGKWVPVENDKPKSNAPSKDYSSDYRNAKKARLQAEQELQKEITQGLEESLDKQLAMTEQKYNEKKFKLQQENADLHLDIQKLQEEAKISKDPNIRKAIEEKRQLIEINKKIEVEFEKQKQAELQEVRDKYHIKEVERTLKEYNDCIDIKKREKAEEILLIEDLEMAKDKLRTTLSEKELSKIKTLEDAKKALRKQADKEVLQTSLESFEAQKQLVLAYLNSVSDGEAKDKLLEDLQKIDEAITKIKEKQGEASPQTQLEGEAEKVDILGFSAKEWEDVFNNLDETSNRIRAVEMSMGALNNAFSMFSQLQQNLNDKEMRSFSANQDKKKKALLGQLNQGYISQAQYHKELQRLDEETESKKKELAIRQFKAKKAMDMANIITNTAVGVMRAYADGGILGGTLFAAIVAGIGAIQLGLVATQQPPSYARGGRTKGLGFTDESGHEVAGVVHADEYVIPKWLRKDPEVAHVEEWLEAKRTGNRQQTLGNSYSNGGRVAPADNQNHEVVNQHLQNVRSATNETVLLSALERLIELLEKLDKEGIDAYIISDAKNGKELQKALKLYQELKDKNKR